MDKSFHTFDNEQARALMREWITTLEKIAEEASRKEYFYFYFYCVLNILTISCTILSSALLSFSEIQRVVPQTFSLIASIVLGITTHTHPDAKSTMYGTFFRNCQALQSQIQYDTFQTFPDDQIAMVMQKLQQQMQTIINASPQLVQSESARTTGLVGSKKTQPPRPLPLVHKI